MTVNEMWELYCEGAIEDVMAAAFYTLLVDALKADVIALEDIL